MNIVSLTALEAASSSFTHKLQLFAADIAALTSGVAASIFPGFNGTVQFPAGCYLIDSAAFVKTGFTGDPGTLTFGVSDGTNQLIATATDLKTTGNTAGFNLTKPVVYSAASKISITVTSQNAITNWTGGEVDIYLNFVDLNTLSR
jgi:hypothetical protein